MIRTRARPRRRTRPIRVRIRHRVRWVEERGGTLPHCPWELLTVLRALRGLRAQTGLRALTVLRVLRALTGLRARTGLRVLRVPDAPVSLDVTAVAADRGERCCSHDAKLSRITAQR